MVDLHQHLVPRLVLPPGQVHPDRLLDGDQSLSSELYFLPQSDDGQSAPLSFLPLTSDEPLLDPPHQNLEAESRDKSIRKF